MPRTPDVGDFVRGTGKLLKIEHIQPPPPPSYDTYIFEEITARCELRLKQEVIHHIQTLNDFYGIGTSVETAIKEMKEYARQKKLTSKSEIAVVVLKVVSQFRARTTSLKNSYEKEYPDFRYADWPEQRGLPDPIITIAWTSKEEE